MEMVDILKKNFREIGTSWDVLKRKAWVRLGLERSSTNG